MHRIACLRGPAHFVVVAGLLLLLTPAFAFAEVIAFWNFNSLAEEGATRIPVSTGVDSGAMITLFGGSALPEGQAGFKFSYDGRKVAPGKALAWGSGVNDEGPNGMTIAFDATGHAGVKARFDVRSTKTGSPGFELQYRVGGEGEFTEAEGVRKLEGDSDFHVMSLDLSEFDGLSGESVEIRFVFEPGRSSGTTRIDNVQITGTPN